MRRILSIAMCGIAGFISLNADRPDPVRLDRMVATLRHRGPDDKGTFCNGTTALGAARLSIIDVAGGHQPISVDGGAITVVQNGEIYNYVELRDELQRHGRQFATACDTEVIAHLYATEGVSGFQRMRGMFAVAVWDEARQQLVLAPGGLFTGRHTPRLVLRRDGALCSLFGAGDTGNTHE